MGIFQAIGRGFSESRKLLNIVLIFFIFNFGMGLVMLPFSGRQSLDANGLPQFSPAAFAISILSVLFFIFLQGGALAMIRDLIKKGSASLGEFAANGKKYYLRILGLLAVIIVVATILVAIASIISAGFVASANNPFVRGVVVTVIVAIGILSAVLLLYPIYVIVNDEAGPIAALSRGIGLSTKNFWPSLGLVVVLFLITFLIAFVVSSLAIALGGVLPLTAGQVITLLVNSAAQSYLTIVMMIALMEFYLSLAGPKKQDMSSPSTI